MSNKLARKPDYVQQFLREATNHTLVEHENVVRVLELDVVRGRVYFTMELVEGETLRDRLKREPMPKAENIHLMMQITRELLAAHEHGLNHRDLKPSNVILTQPSTH